MNKHKTTKTSQIKEHLIKHGSITSWDAIRLYRATRLSGIIYNLKKRGMEITTQNVINEEGRYANYIYEGEKNNG